MHGAGGGPRRGKPKDSDASSDEDDSDSKEPVPSTLTLNVSKPETSLPTSARTTPGTSRRGSDVYSIDSRTSSGYQTPTPASSSSSMPSRASPMLSRHSAPARADRINTGRRNSIPESIFHTSVGILGAIAKIPKRLAFPDDVESQSSELLEPMTAPSSWASAPSKKQCNCLKQHESAFPNYKLVCKCNFKKLNQLSKPSEEQLMKVTEAESTYSVRRIKCPHSGESRKALAQQATGKDGKGGKGPCCNFGAVMKKKIQEDDDSKRKEKDTSYPVPERKQVSTADSGKRTPTLIPKPPPPSDRIKPTIGAAEKDRGKPLDLAPQPGPSRQGSETKLTIKKSSPESKQAESSPKVPVRKKDSPESIKIIKSPSDGKITKKPIEVVKDPPVHSGVVRVSSKSSWQQISKLEVITEEQAEVDKTADKTSTREVSVIKPPKPVPEKQKPLSPAPQSSPRSIKQKPDTISTKPVPSTSSVASGPKTPSRKGSEIYEKDTLSRKPSTTSATSQSIKAAKDPIPEKITTTTPGKKVVLPEQQKEETKTKIPDQPSKQSTDIPDEVSSVQMKDSSPSRRTSASSISSEAKKPVDKIPPGKDEKPSTEVKPAQPIQPEASPKPSKKDVEPKKIPEDASKKSDVDEVYKPVVATTLPLPSPRDDQPLVAKQHGEKEDPDTKPEEKAGKRKPVEDHLKKDVETDDNEPKHKILTIREDKNISKVDSPPEHSTKEKHPIKKEHDEGGIVLEKKQPKEDLLRKEEPHYKQEGDEKQKVESHADKKRPVESHADEKQPEELHADKKQPQESHADKKEPEEPSTHRKEDQKPVEMPSEVKQPKEKRWGREKPPSKQEVDEKPKVESSAYEKRPKESQRSKDKPSTHREDEHIPVESPSEVKKKLWGKAKPPSKQEVDEKPKVESSAYEKRPKESQRSKDKPSTHREDERIPVESPSEVKKKLWGKAKPPSKQEVEKPIVESPADKKQPKKEKIPRKREGDEEKSVEPVADNRQPKESRWGKQKEPTMREEPQVKEKRTKPEKKINAAKISVTNFKARSIMGIKSMLSGTKRTTSAQEPSSSAGAATSKPQPVQKSEILSAHPSMHSERRLIAKEKNYSDWKHAIFAQDSNLIEEIKALIRDEREENKIFNECKSVRKSFVEPLLSHTRIGEAKSSEAKTNRSGDRSFGHRKPRRESDDSSSSNCKPSGSKERFSKRACGKGGSEGKSVMSFWKNISRVTPVRKHSTEKSDDKKDRKDSSSSKSSKDRYSKRAYGGRESDENPMTKLWRNISRITPITQEKHGKDGRTSSGRLIDDSNVYVAERMRPSTPIYLRSKQSHHSMMRTKTGYWIDEKGLYREIVDMAHDHHAEDPPISVRSSRWYKRSDQDIPGTSKDNQRS